MSARAELVPHFTPIPDVILDFWLPLLSLPERAIVCYVARKTYGWRKECEAISLSQFQHGVKRRDGTYADRGTGMSRSEVCDAVNSLVALGVLHKQTRQAENGANLPTLYSLNLAWDYRTSDRAASLWGDAPSPCGGLGGSPPHGLPPTPDRSPPHGLPLVRVADPQQTWVQETYKETTAATNKGVGTLADVGAKGGGIGDLEALLATHPLSWSEEALLAEADRREACGVPSEKAAVKAAAAACLCIEEGDADGDLEEAVPSGEDEEALSPREVASRFNETRSPIEDRHVRWAFEQLGMKASIGERLLLTHEPSEIAFWIVRCADKRNPCGFIVQMLDTNQPRVPVRETKSPPAQARESAAAPPAPPPPPRPLRIAEYRPPAAEPPQTDAQIAASFRRCLEDPHLTDFGRRDLLARIERLEAKQERLRRGETP